MTKKKKILEISDDEFIDYLYYEVFCDEHNGWLS